MEFNFDKIKDLMQGDHHQPLPPALDWSNMKDGILDKMQAIEQAEASPANNKGPKKRIWLLLSLFLTLSSALTAGLFFFYQAGTTDMGPATVAPSTEATIVESGSTATDQVAPTHRDGYAEAEMAGTDGTADTYHLPQADEETAAVQRQQERQSVQMRLALSPETQAVLEKDGVNNFADAGRVEAPQSGPETARRMLTPLTVSPVAKLKPDNLDAGESMSVSADLLGLSESIRASAGSQAADSTSPPTIQQTRPVDRLILEGGVNFWDEGYGNARPERAQYEAPIPSFQLQGYYMKGLKRGYFLMAGLQYQRLESKLAYNSTIEDYLITLKDTILQVRQNLLTGEETIVRGDAVQAVQAERRVRHFNKTQLFKASLAIGKNWRFHAFQTDVYLGGALNGLARNEGRTFFEGEIMDYNRTANPFFQNQ
ncbi:MAG: hypothetical protein OHK0039_10470 [Bacteroidia bacterium]